MTAFSYSLIHLGIILYSLCRKKYLETLFQSYKKDKIYPSSGVARKLKSTAIALVATALSLCSLENGWSIGAVYFTGMLSIAAFSHAMLLAYKPKLIFPISAILIVASATNLII